MTDIHETLARLDELEAKASPANWTQRKSRSTAFYAGGIRVSQQPGYIGGQSNSAMQADQERRETNAELIVELRNVYPHLAAHLRRQEEQLAQAREIIEAVARGYSGLTVKHRAAAWLAANNEGV